MNPIFRKIAAGDVDELFVVRSSVRENPFSVEGLAKIGITPKSVFRDGIWINGRRLNGDEEDQGRAWRFGSWFGPQIERCRIYRY